MTTRFTPRAPGKIAIYLTEKDLVILTVSLENACPCHWCRKERADLRRRLQNILGYEQARRMNIGQSVHVDREAGRTETAGTGGDDAAVALQPETRPHRG